MNSFEHVAEVIKEIFQSIEEESFSYNFFTMLTNKDVSHKLYQTICKWITDPILTPDIIMHMLGTYLPKLVGFTTNCLFQNLMGFFCIRALAERRPVLTGAWENVAYAIVKYSKYYARPHELDSESGKKMVNDKKSGVRWLNRMQKLCSPKYCPNPCLRLELIRLKMLFSPLFGELDFDRNSHRELTIKIICDVYDASSHLTLDQLPMFVQDFQMIILGNFMDIHIIMNKDNLSSKQTKIIGAIIKITEMFALREKSKPVGKQSQLNLYICSTLCGLLGENDGNLKSYISYFMKAVNNEPILLDCFIETYRTIHDAALMLGQLYNEPLYNDDGKPLHSHTRIRDIVLNMFSRQYVSIIPMHYHLREINGGITPAAEYRVRHFSKNIKKSSFNKYHLYEDNFSEEIDSEEIDSEEVDSEEVDFEMDSEEVGFEEFDSEEFDFDEFDSYEFESNENLLTHQIQRFDDSDDSLS